MYGFGIKVCSTGILVYELREARKAPHNRAHFESLVVTQ